MKTPVIKASAAVAVATAAATSSNLAVDASSSTSNHATTVNGRRRAFVKTATTSPTSSSTSISNFQKQNIVDNYGWVRLFPRGGHDGEAAGSSDDGSKNEKEGKSKQTPRQKKKKKKTQEKHDEAKTKSKGSKDANKTKSAEFKKKNSDSTTTSTSPNTDDSTKKHAPPRKHNRIVEDILKHEDDYYHVLGLDKNSAASLTSAQITKAYRKRAVQTHPDKTDGDRRAFDIVAEAYDVLSDDDKKQVYDRYGKAGVEQQKNGGGMPSNYQDLFRSMFQQQQREQAQPRNPTMRYQLQVTLEELYEGTTQSVRVTSPLARHHYFSSHSHHKQQEKDVQVHIPEGSIAGESIVLSGEMDFEQDQTPGDIIFVLTQVPHNTFTRKGHDIAMELPISLEEAICGFSRTIRHLNGQDITITSAAHTHGRHSHHLFGKHDDNDASSSTAPVIINSGDVQVLKGMGMPKRHYEHKHHHDDDGDHLHSVMNVHDHDTGSVKTGGDTKKFGDLYVQFRVDLPKSTNRSENALTEDERNELSRLLRKLEGKDDTRSSQNTKRTKEGDDSHQEEVPFQLQTAKASDFGRASGRVTLEQDDHHHEDDGFHNPFGSSFFHQSTDSGNFYYRTFGSFGHNGYSGDDDQGGQTQCQQM